MRFIRACALGAGAAVKRMIDQGMNVNEPRQQENGDYPLPVAASQLQPETVRVLLDHNACVHCINDEMGTPLIAALNTCRELVSKLGACSFHSFRADHFISSCESIVYLLLANGMIIDNDIGDFDPPLHIASLLGSEAIVTRLLRKEQTSIRPEDILSTPCSLL